MTRRPRSVVVAALAAVTLGLGALAGCSTPTAPETFTPSTLGTPSASATPTGVVPTGAPADVVTGLASPWSILRVSSSLTLVSERDSGVIERVTAAGALQKIGTVPDVVHDGEGGLLGLAYLEASPGTTTSWLYAYETTASDNRIVRMTIDKSLTLGPPHVILKGLIAANHHDGGRIAFGPDGMLYATVGDAGDTSNSQNLSSLNGKILRMTPTGGVPGSNPFPGSLIWSYGHRNPQGLAWDSSGQLYAAEFGQDTWDEFNKITKGSNYGWPIVEGIAHDPRFVDPLVQWSTDDASPSGLTYLDGTFFLAGLGGKRLWVINVDAAGAATAAALYVGQYGRLRDVTAGPSTGSLPSLWILTDNTDGRGSPKPGDDRILQVALTVAG
jgi:glucose/arabinose dehydrogenase